MKTLNLNKIILLTTLFLAAIAFSNSANALCVVNGAGAIVIADDGSDESTLALIQEFSKKTFKTT